MQSRTFFWLVAHIQFADNFPDNVLVEALCSTGESCQQGIVADNINEPRDPSRILIDLVDGAFIEYPQVPAPRLFYPEKDVFGGFLAGQRLEVVPDDYSLLE